MSAPNNLFDNGHISLGRSVKATTLCVWMGKVALLTSVVTAEKYNVPIIPRLLKLSTRQAILVPSVNNAFERAAMSHNGYYDEH